ncbi:MAG: SHOCT domain-containing protein [Jatrophihabitantaceae bacterium]
MTGPRGRGRHPDRRRRPDRLAELTDLRDRGLITADEYQARRGQIIDGI